MSIHGINNLVYYRRSLLFLVFYEMFQRFSFYGFQAILFLYLKHELDLQLHNAIGFYHLYVGLSCFVPVFGTLIADLYMNKVYSLLLMACYSTVGSILIIIASSVSEEWNQTKCLMEHVGTIVFFALFARALGGGGSREIVRSLGEDQLFFPGEEKALLNFHQLLHYFMTFGTIMAFLIPPVLRMHVECFGQVYCFAAAFGLPAAFMLLAMVALMSGYSRLRPGIPRESVIIEFFLCIMAALRNVYGGGAHWVDNASYAYHDDFLDMVQETIRVLWMFLALPMFWALFEQAGSRWVHQATHMKGTIDRDTNWYVEPDNMPVIIPIVIFIVMPVFEYLLYPLFEWYNVLRTPKQRMYAGAVLAIVAFLAGGIVEWKNEPTHVPQCNPGEGGFAVYNMFGSCEIEVTTDYPQLKKFLVPPLGHRLIEQVPVKGIVPITFHFKSVSTKRYNCTLKTDYEGNTSLVENRTVGIINLFIINVKQEAGKTVHMLKNPIDGIFNDSQRCDLQLPRVGVIYFVGYGTTHDTRAESKTDWSIFTTDVVLLGHWEYHGYIKKYLDPNHNFIDYFHAKPTNYDIRRTKSVPEDRKLSIGLSRGEVGILHVKMIVGTNIVTYNYTRLRDPVTIPMFRQIPQYILIAMAAFLLPFNMLEYALSQVSFMMRPVITSFWLISIALGNFIVAIISFENIFKRELWYYLFFALLMLFNCGLLMVLLFNYIPTREAMLERESRMGKTFPYATRSARSMGSQSGRSRTNSNSTS